MFRSSQAPGTIMVPPISMVIARTCRINSARGSLKNRATAGAARIRINVSPAAAPIPVQNAVDQSLSEGLSATTSAGCMPRSLNTIRKNRNGAAIWIRPKSSGLRSRVSTGRIRMAEAIRAALAAIVQIAPLATRWPIGATPDGPGVAAGGAKDW